MSSKSDYLEQKMLEYVLGKETFTVPDTLYFGLWITGLENTSTGSSGTEVTGSGYGRVAVDNNSTTWGVSGVDGSGIRKNKIAITFPAAAEDWGTVTQVGICDATTGGNLLFYGNLSTPRTILSGNTYEFDVDTITFTED